MEIYWMYELNKGNMKNVVFYNILYIFCGDFYEVYVMYCKFIYTVAIWHWLDINNIQTQCFGAVSWEAPDCRQRSHGADKMPNL